MCGIDYCVYEGQFVDQIVDYCWDFVLDQVIYDGEVFVQQQF